jgi:hypothetical protein
MCSASQYKSDLQDVFREYLKLLAPYTPHHRLRKEIVRCQAIVLDACDWRVSLDEGRDLRPALTELQAHPMFHQLCNHITSESKRYAPDS